jgi:hypothetical protein
LASVLSPKFLCVSFSFYVLVESMFSIPSIRITVRCGKNV